MQLTLELVCVKESLPHVVCDQQIAYSIYKHTLIKMQLCVVHVRWFSYIL